MSKYSNHSTIGGQVLTHRSQWLHQDDTAKCQNYISDNIQMISVLSGRIAFIVRYLGYLFIKFHICRILSVRNLGLFLYCKIQNNAKLDNFWWLVYYRLSMEFSLYKRLRFTSKSSCTKSCKRARFVLDARFMD